MGYGRYLKAVKVGDGYEVTKGGTYYSPRYNRHITISYGMFSDGATSARDLKNTDAWIVHDAICRWAVWDDGTKITNWEASMVLADILWRDGYKFEATTWLWATFLFGGGAARENGMFRIK